MINNLTYRSVEEASQLGEGSLRIYGKLVAHRIDAVMYNVRWPRASADHSPSTGLLTQGLPASPGTGYNAWFARR